MRINTARIGIASGMITAAWFGVCGLLVAVAPGATSTFLGWVLHIDLSSLARPISVSSFIGGLILFSVFVGICVAGTAWLYKKLTAQSYYQPA